MQKFIFHDSLPVWLLHIHCFCLNLPT